VPPTTPAPRVNLLQLQQVGCARQSAASRILVLSSGVGTLAAASGSRGLTEAVRQAQAEFGVVAAAIAGSTDVTARHLNGVGTRCPVVTSDRPVPYRPAHPAPLLVSRHTVVQASPSRYYIELRLPMPIRSITTAP